MLLCTCCYGTAFTHMLTHFFLGQARMDMMVPILNFPGKGGRKELVVKTSKMRTAGSASGTRKVAKSAKRAQKKVQLQAGTYWRLDVFACQSMCC